MLGYTDLHGISATYDELYNVFRLSGDIAFNLGKMAATAKEDGKPHVKRRKSKEKLPCPLGYDEVRTKPALKLR